MFKGLSRLQLVIFVIALILWIPLLGCIIYGIYLDFQPPPPLSPMQKQTERYAHYFGFPWQNVYVDAVGISDWCYHEKWGRIQTDHYYYEVVTSDQTHYLILVGYDPLAIYEDLHDGQPYRLIGDTTKIVDRVFKGVAELKAQPWTNCGNCTATAACPFTPVGAKNCPPHSMVNHQGICSKRKNTGLPHRSGKIRREILCQSNF